MSSNKGKDGEMRVLQIVAGIAIEEDGFDFTRPTITNESDMGADLMIKSSPQSLNRLIQVAAGEASSSLECSVDHSKRTIESRVDVKTTQNKIQADTIDKFASDVRKHPGCTAHILIGGSNLTGPAQRKFNGYRECFSEEGKELFYISNEGINRLALEYIKPIVVTSKDGEND